MMRLLTILLLSIAVVILPTTDRALAKSSSSHSTYSSSHKSKSTIHSSSGTHKGGKKKTPGVKRDKHGKIERSSKAKDAFRKTHPCPSTGKTTGACPGYVIDHIRPLKRGGADSPSNMHWQTKADAKAKDKWE